MICQPSLFAHLNSRYHAFKSEVLKDSHCETAQFWARYIDIILMVLTLIRATRKTTLNCMSALSICLVPKVHCTQLQQLRTICTCVTDYTHNLSDTHHRWKNFNKMGLVCHNHCFFFCLRNAFEITLRQTIKRFYRFQQLELHLVLQMEWCITHHIRAQYIETSLQWTEMKYSICSNAK